MKMHWVEVDYDKPKPTLKVSIPTHKNFRFSINKLNKCSAVEWREKSQFLFNHKKVFTLALDGYVWKENGKLEVTPYKF